MEECQNCGRGIGGLETSYIWRGSTVCAECSQRLQDTVSLAPPVSSVPQDPLDALAQAIPRSTVRPTYVQNVYHQTNRPRVQTIEKTGKVWKAQMVLSVLVALLGVVIITVSTGMPELGDPLLKLLGGLVVAVGIVWHILARIGAWWHHG